MTRFVRAAATLAIAASSACTLGPDYERPDLPVPEGWRFSSEGALEAVDVAWWSFFNDPVLDALVDEALRNNLDLRIAAARVDEFAARIGVTRSGAFPQVGYDGEAGQQQLSREIGLGKAGGQRVSDFYGANLNFGWELDIFGRVRRATEAAEADTLAAEEARRGVILSLVTSVASGYVGLRSLDAQLETARRALRTRAETVALFELQFERGVISQLELAQIRSEYERTAATIPVIEREIAFLENLLSLLLGRPPGPIDRGAGIAELVAPPVPAGLPSDLLRRRPDLRGAEQRLIAANARIGQAVAEFYPSFSLTAVLGVASDDLANLATGSAALYTLAGGVAGPIFTSGFLESQLDAAEAVERQAIEGYRLALLTALREAEDALVRRRTVIEEAGAQLRQTEALAEYADLASKRYDNGYVGYLEVLDAERDLFDAQLTQIRLRAEVLSSLIGIYKAFGGGWVSVAEEIAEDGGGADSVE